MINCVLRIPRLSRGLATHVGPVSALPAALHLKTGQSFLGRSFGAPTSVYGETVFSTSITSCMFLSFTINLSFFSFLGALDTESMTDPSYRGQILVFTTPLIGNYGVPFNKTPIDAKDVGVVLESQKIQCSAVVVCDVAEKFSHYTAVESIASWCQRHHIPGITGVDTRAVTRLLRDQGTTLGRIAVGADASAPAPQSHEYWDPTTENLVDQVSTKVPYEINPMGDIRIAVLDFGVKANILRCLVRRGAAVTVLPWNYDFNTIRDHYDGLFLTNGPGDPMHCMEAALHLRRTLKEWDKPVFGICMGHQVIGIAAGLDAYRMTFGNRGHNQPVLALASSGSIKAGRVYVTRYVSLAYYPIKFRLSYGKAKITNTRSSCRIPSLLGGSPFSSTATTPRSKESNLPLTLGRKSGVFSSIPRVLADHLTPLRYLCGLLERVRSLTFIRRCSRTLSPNVALTKLR